MYRNPDNPFYIKIISVLITVFLILQPCSISICEITDTDLSNLTTKELETLSNDIDKAISLYHTPDSTTNKTILSTTKKAVEDYFSQKKSKVSWAWYDREFFS